MYDYIISERLMNSLQEPWVSGLPLGSLGAQLTEPISTSHLELGCYVRVFSRVLTAHS